MTAVNSAGESAPSNEARGVAQPVTQLLTTNAGFENANHQLGWTTTADVINASPLEPAHAGNWKAWLDGYGVSHTDTLSPNIVIPATVNHGLLSFSLHIDTAERTQTTPYDTLVVQVQDLSGHVLGVIPEASNLDAAPGYVQAIADLSPFLGQQPVKVVLVGKEDSSLQTSFVADDFSLSVQ